MCSARFIVHSGAEVTRRPTAIHQAAACHWSPPLPLPLQGAPLDLFSEEEAPAEYARVWVEGVFDHSASQWVGPRTRQLAGVSKQVCARV